MPAPLAERSTQRPLDTAALAHLQRRLQRSAEPPWLHAEAARRMAERLPVVKLQPAAVLDWGAFLGASQALLARAYPRARIDAVESTPARRDATVQRLAQPWWSARRWRHGVPPVRLEADVPDASAQLLWSNMQLHAALDPLAVFERWFRATAVDGFLMFSTLGPGTLAGLRALYEDAGWPPPMAPLVDMHDLGDMLVHAGYADPVMDQETLTLSWATPQALLAELRGLGGNLHPRRHAGLRTPHWRELLLQRLARRAGADGRVSLEFELVYGHAFKPLPRPQRADQTLVPLQAMRDLIRGRAARS